MARKARPRKQGRKIRPVRRPAVPGSVIDCPTPEQMAGGEFVRANVAHVETFTVATAWRRSRPSSLAAMRDKGTLSEQQLSSAQQIAAVVERLRRSVEARCASMEARVDCSRSADGQIIESLHDVRLERAYSEWRQSLPMPRAMIIEMVTRDHRLSAIGRRYGHGWPKAARLLRDALDAWPDIFGCICRQIDRQDVISAGARLTCAPQMA